MLLLKKKELNYSNSLKLSLRSLGMIGDVVYMVQRETMSSGFPTRSDMNWGIQPLKMARGLKFRI